MITCVFEDGGKGSFRHVVLHAIVEKDGQILLEKRTGKLLESGKWALPGGFLDRFETAADGVLRELREETGWQGEVISLFRINTNPNRPKEDRQNVALEFLMKPIKQVGKPDHESSDIQWVSLDKLPPTEEIAFDHEETIKLFLKYRNRPFQLPLLV